MILQYGPSHGCITSDLQPHPGWQLPLPGPTGPPRLLAASDLIQASGEAKAPLAESLGVCVALWTRMGFDVSEAVSQPYAQAVTGGL